MDILFYVAEGRREIRTRRKIMPIFNNIGKVILNKEFTFNITSGSDGYILDEYSGNYDLYTGTYRKNIFQMKYYYESERLFVYNTELHKNEQWYKNCMAAITEMDTIQNDEEERFNDFIHHANYEVEPVADTGIFHIYCKGRYIYQVIAPARFDSQLLGSRVGSPLAFFDAGTQGHDLGVIRNHIDYRKYQINGKSK